MPALFSCLAQRGDGRASVQFMAGGAREPQGSPVPSVRSLNRVSSATPVAVPCGHNGSTTMKPSEQPLDQRDQLETALYQLQAEVGLILDLVNALPPQSVQIGSANLAGVLDGFLRQLEGVRRLIGTDVGHEWYSPTSRADHQ
jgi:hypothetical protein